MNDPSVEAKVLSSRRKNMLEFTNRAPALSAAALAARSTPTLSSTATVKGSISIAERQVPLGVGVTGASTTGRTTVTRDEVARVARQAALQARANSDARHFVPRD